MIGDFLYRDGEPERRQSRLARRTRIFREPCGGKGKKRDRDKLKNIDNGQRNIF